MDYHTETLRAYRNHAPALSRKYGRLREILSKQEVLDFVERLQGPKILDIGCGSGDYAQDFNHRGLEVTAIDFAEEMADLARSKGVDARVQSIEEMNFDASSFNGIWAVTSLHHVPKAELPNVRDKAYNFLTPQGVFYVCVKEGTSEGFVQDGKSGTQRFYALYKPHELVGLMSPKFEIISVRRVLIDQITFVSAMFKKL
jgi:ubiquinone/menaquinone biosynthesis C-methylase UbiE